MSAPDAAPSAPAAAPTLLDPRRARAVLIVLSVIALMVTYVETMIIPGLQTFSTFFDDAPISTVSWILTAYLLVGVVATPIVGKLGDIYGKKRMLMVVLVIYAIAVTLAGFSPNIGASFGLDRGEQIYVLIGIRAIQGVGVAMFPLAFAMIGEEFPRQQVAQAQGIVSAMFAAGAAIGLFGGAAVTQTLGWQATYHTVIPVAIGALIAAWLLLHESRIRLQQRLDYVGAGLLGGALAFGIIGLVQAPTWGWGNWSAVTIGGVQLGSPTFFVIALLLAIGFVFWERHTDRPVVDFAKMAERNIWVSNMVGMLAGTAMFMFFVGLTYLAELPVAPGFGFTPLQFGLLSLPATFANMAIAPMVGRWIGRAGPKPAMLLGGALVTAAGFWLVFFNSEWYYLVIASIPLFVGVIMVFISMTNTVVTSSRPQEVGVQTGMNQTFRNLGTTVGPAIAATILTSFVVVITFPDGMGGFTSVSVPTLDAFRYVFIAIGALGVSMLALTAFVRNFRFTADGQRESLVAKPEAGAGALGGQPSGTSPSRSG